MHDLVVRERQDEIFAEGIHEAEGQLVLTVAAIERILAHERKRVVHPAHVPLVAEAEAAEVHRLRHLRPVGRLFGDRDRAGLLGVECLVRPRQELDRAQILAPAIPIRYPFAGLSAVIEVEHGRDGVDAQTVDVIAIGPEQRVREQVVRHFGALEIVDQRVPVGLVALARIGMFVEVRAVKIGEAMGIGRKVAGDPIEQDAEGPLRARGPRRPRNPRAIRSGSSARTSRWADTPHDPSNGYSDTGINSMCV